MNVHRILEFFFERLAPRSFTQQFTVQMIHFSPAHSIIYRCHTAETGHRVGLEVQPNPTYFHDHLLDLHKNDEEFLGNPIPSAIVLYKLLIAVKINQNQQI